MINEKEKVSIVQTLERIKKTHEQLQEGFKAEQYEEYKKIIQDIADDIALVLLVSEERYQERLRRRPLLNHTIEARINKEKQIYVKKQWDAYVQNMVKETFLDKGDGRFFQKPIPSQKFKAKDFEKWFAPEKGSILGSITKDHYAYIAEKIKQQGNKIINALETALTLAKAKCKDMFQEYTTPEELLKNAGIKYKQKSYDLLAEGNGKEKWWTRGTNGPDIITTWPEVKLNFKKIGYIIKYLKETNCVDYQIFIDPKDRLYMYLLEKNISIIVSDIVTNNKFKDATYIIRWPLLESKPLNKEELSEMQGKRIIYTDTRGRRIEEILDENPSSRPNIGEVRDDDEIQEKTLITDKKEFISIMKDNFTRDTLTRNSYSEFAKAYNADEKNAYFLRETLNGNGSILGVGNKSSTTEIKNSIFWNPSNSTKEERYSYLTSDEIKTNLIKLSTYGDFNPDRDFWITSYWSRIVNILKIGFDEKDKTIIEKKSMPEKKKVLKEVLGFDLPLRGGTLSLRLWGEVSSGTIEYQKMLWEKFLLEQKKETGKIRYKILIQEIAQYERERKRSISPNSKKTEIKEKTETQIGAVLKKNKEIVPISFQDIQYTVHDAKIIGEDTEYRVVEIPGYIQEIRLYKRNISSDKDLAIGKKVPVFGVRMFEKFTKVLLEKQKWFHKVIKFFNETKNNSNEFIPGETYTGMVNNMNEKHMWVSLTEFLSGRIEIPKGKTFHMGDKIHVVLRWHDRKIPERLNLEIAPKQKTEKKEWLKFENIQLSKRYKTIVEKNCGKFWLLRIPGTEVTFQLFHEDCMFTDLAPGEEISAKPIAKFESSRTFKALVV